MENQDQELWDLLGRAERREAPVGFADTVMRRIAREEQQAVEKRKRPWLGKFSISSPLAWSAVTGAAAMLCVALLLLESNGGGNSASLAAEIDDEVLMDVAFSTLGDKELQDAVYQISSMDDSRQFADCNIAEIILNG